MASQHLSWRALRNTDTRPSWQLADDRYPCCHRQRPVRSTTEDDRRRTTTHRPVTLRPRPRKVSSFDRRAHPAHRQRLPPVSAGARNVVHRESDDRSKRPLGTHRLLERTLAAFHGVWHPTTLTEAGSDQHRVCLTRLCSAFRFSQPLDALLRLQPLRPCFMPVAPMGSRFQRFSLPGSGHQLSLVPSLRAVVDGWFVVCQDGSFPNLGFEGLRIQEVRTVRPVLPGCCRPILS
jgi:hypothetical protein